MLVNTPIPHPESRVSTGWQGFPDTMTTRSATLITIGLLALLLAIVALAALFAGDISERAGAIVTTVLGSFATVLAGLLLFLRVETVAQKQEDVHSKVERVQEFVENGGLRDRVREAIVDAEHDPDLQAHRIENVAKGVSKDRHDKANRDAGTEARAQMERRTGRPRPGGE